MYHELFHVDLQILTLADCATGVRLLSVLFDLNIEAALGLPAHLSLLLVSYKSNQIKLLLNPNGGGDRDKKLRKELDRLPAPLQMIAEE